MRLLPPYAPPHAVQCGSVHRRQRFLRCFEYRGIGERDFFRWRRMTLWCKAERGMLATGDAAASIDEGIEH